MLFFIFIKNELQTIRRYDLPKLSQLSKKLESVVQSRLVTLFSSESADKAFAGFELFKILCSQRSGEHGVRRVNEQVEQILGRQGLTREGRLNYKGKPIIIKENDYTLNLYNGDTGIIWDDEKGNLRAFFPDSNNGFFSVSLARLPKHESAYAITIHESQGSEFDDILVILGETATRLLTRELSILTHTIYNG